MKKSLALLTTVLLSIGSAFAQPAPPPAPNVAIPLDVVVYLLIVAGIGYGSYHLYRKPGAKAITQA
jgi:hypothetical protein